MYTKPTKIPFFCNQDRFRVLDVACGDDHSLVHVEEFDEYGNSLGLRLYQVGFNSDETSSLHRGVTKEELESSNFIAKIKDYDNLEIQAMACGHQCTFVYGINPRADSHNESWAMRNIKNEICPSHFKKGYLHFFNNPEAF
jgi:Regulator of chromosome condensation (RCC1) repeat